MRRPLQPGYGDNINNNISEFDDEIERNDHVQKESSGSTDDSFDVQEFHDRMRKIRNSQLAAAVRKSDW